MCACHSSNVSKYPRGIARLTQMRKTCDPLTLGPQHDRSEPEGLRRSGDG